MATPKIGVYVCHCGTNIAGVIDVKKVMEYASRLPNVVMARDYRFVCSDSGQAIIKEDIEEHDVDRVVVAACSPKLHEPTFRRCIEEAGLNQYLVEMANIREQCSWVHMRRPEEATQKAMDLVRMAVTRASLLHELETIEVPVKNSCMIIGGGITGIQAALDLADEGFEVYLVERSPSIGGHMAQLDKTFPTLDCSMCILAPKMVQVLHHPKIRLLTYSEVKEVSGYMGNFKVKILRKPRYVSEETCNGCGVCVDVCPIEVPNEFDENLGLRKAIYVPFPQAVPLIYVIDRDYCIECEKCIEVCELKAIDLAQEPKEVELEVGTIIVATGFDVFDPTIKEEYGYGVYENVVTAIELERMLSPTGPTGGIVVRPSDRQTPKRIVFIQCVGSRDENTNVYCSRICCMFATKEALLVKEKIPDASLSIFYIDLRTFGKGYEEFYKRAQSEGISFIRGRVAEILESSKTKNLIIRAEDTLLGTPIEREFDLVVLSVGSIPSHGVEELRRILNLSASPDGFFMELHPKLKPIETRIDGVFICGAAQGPKDIQDSVAQAGAAASKASIPMSKGKVRIPLLAPDVDDKLCAVCEICVETCPFSAISINEEKRIVEVVPLQCKGCGSCAADCPTGALQLRHYLDKQILAQITSLFRAEGGMKQAEEGTFEPAIVAFCCNECAYAAADLAGTSRMEYPTNVRIIRVPCTGKVDITYIFKAFEQGADGVFVAGCLKDQCHYVDGNYEAERRVKFVKEVLDAIGFGGERLEMYFMSAAMADKFTETAKIFTEKIKRLGMNPLKLRKETDKNPALPLS